MRTRGVTKERSRAETVQLGVTRVCALLTEMEALASGGAPFNVTRATHGCEHARSDPSKSGLTVAYVCAQVARNGALHPAQRALRSDCSSKFDSLELAYYMLLFSVSPCLTCPLLRGGSSRPDDARQRASFVSGPPLLQPARPRAFPYPHSSASALHPSHHVARGSAEEALQAAGEPVLRQLRRGEPVRCAGGAETQRCLSCHTRTAANHRVV